MAGVCPDGRTAGAETSIICTPETISAALGRMMRKVEEAPVVSSEAGAACPERGPARVASTTDASTRRQAANNGGRFIKGYSSMLQEYQLEAADARI